MADAAINRLMFSIQKKMLTNDRNFKKEMEEVLSNGHGINAPIIGPTGKQIYLLENAVNMRDEVSVRMLLDRGADPTLTGDGKSLLQICSDAMRMNPQIHEPWIRISKMLETAL